MSVDSVWEPILDIFSHHCTEPVFHSDCRGWKHTLSFSCDIFFFPVIAIVCLVLAGAAASQCGLFSQRVLT